MSEENQNSKRHRHPNMHCRNIYNSQDMGATKKSINRWMGKEVVHVHNGILLNHGKKWNNVTCSNVDGSRDNFWPFLSPFPQNHALSHPPIIFQFLLVLLHQTISDLHDRREETLLCILAVSWDVHDISSSTSLSICPMRLTFLRVRPCHSIYCIISAQYTSIKENRPFGKWKK